MKIKSVKNTFGTAILCVFAAFLTSACSGSSGGDPVNNSGPGTTPNPVDNTDGSSPVDEIPVAVADEVITDTDPITINILSNDFGLGDIPLTISIPDLPAYGNLAVQADNSVTFNPNSGYIGIDSFTYLVTDSNGDSATAVVRLDIRCVNCSERVLQLSWNPDQNDVDGYNVYFGVTGESASKLLSTVPYSSGSNTRPSVEYNVGGDLALSKDDNICFRLKSYNSYGESDFSAPVCTLI